MIFNFFEKSRMHIKILPCVIKTKRFGYLWVVSKPSWHPHRVWKIPLSFITWKTPKNLCWQKSKQAASGTLRGWKPTYCPNRGYLSLSWFSPQYQLYGIVDALKSGIRKKVHSILRCHSRSPSRSFPGITTSHSRSQNSGMEFPFPFPFPKIGNEIFIPVPVPKSWECNLSFPFPFPKFGNGLSHSRSRSQMSKSHSRSPLDCMM